MKKKSSHKKSEKHFTFLKVLLILALFSAVLIFAQTLDNGVEMKAPWNDASDIFAAPDYSKTLQQLVNEDYFADKHSGECFDSNTAIRGYDEVRGIGGCSRIAP